MEKVSDMRQRPSARLLVLNDKDEVLLFRFVHKRGPLAGQNYWATPGGALEEGETFQQAAARELKEETGLECSQFSAEVAQREFVLQLASGEYVEADERYFIVRPAAEQLSFVGWTDLEVEVMAEHKWWSLLEIANTSETIWPENLQDANCANRTVEFKCTKTWRISDCAWFHCHLDEHENF